MSYKTIFRLDKTIIFEQEGIVNITGVKINERFTDAPEVVLISTNRA